MVIEPAAASEVLLFLTVMIGLPILELRYMEDLVNCYPTGRSRQYTTLPICSKI